MPKLPSEHLDKDRTVADMMIGESGYVTDFALEVFDDDTAYLKGYSKVYNEQYSSSLYVEKRADGFYVRLAKGVTFKPMECELKRDKDRYEVIAWLE